METAIPVHSLENGPTRICLWGLERETAQQLRALSALADDWSSFPAPTSSSSQSPLTPAPGDPTPSSGHPGWCSHVQCNILTEILTTNSTLCQSSLFVHLGISAHSILLISPKRSSFVFTSTLGHTWRHIFLMALRSFHTSPCNMWTSFYRTEKV